MTLLKEILSESKMPKNGWPVRIEDKDKQTFAYDGKTYKIGPYYEGAKIVTPAAEIFTKYIKVYKSLKGEARHKRIMDDYKSQYIT